MQDRQYYVKSVKKIIDEFNILPAGYIAPIKDSLEAISEYDVALSDPITRGLKGCFVF